MDERILQLRVGVVVISAIIITVILVVIFGEFRPSTYTVKMKASQVPGVSENTPIRKNGLTIGRISKVEPTPEGVLLEAEIDTDADIYQSEAAEIGSASVINDDAVINIVPGKGEFVSTKIPDGAWIDDTRLKPGINEALEELLNLRFAVETNLSQAANSIEQASQSISHTSDQIGQVAVSVNDILTEEDGEFRQMFETVQDLATEIEVAVQNASQVMADVDAVIGDPAFQKDIKDSVNRIPGVIDNADQLVLGIQETAEEFRKVGESVDRNLQNLEGLTGPLGENGDQILADFQVALNDVDKMVNQVTKFITAINDSDGNVSLILKDRKLYDSLLRSMNNVEEITRKVKPIIADVRTTTSKIATDPRIMGVKGALDRRPSGSGPKGTLLYRGPVGEE